MHDTVRQQALTVALPVRAGQAAALDAWLTRHAADVKQRLRAVMSLHFGRFVLLPHGATPEADDAARASALLLVESNFDGELDAHLEDLWRGAGDALALLFAHCDGWAPPGDAPAFGRYVRAHLRAASAFFVAHPGLSVARVRADARLRAEVGRYLDERQDALTPLSAEEVVQELRAALTKPNGDVPGSEERRVSAPARSTLAVLGGHAWALAGTLARALVFDFLDWIRGLWDDRTPPVPARTTLERIGREEAGRLQLGLTHVARVKPGAFRRGALRLALRLTDELSRAASPSGKLGGIASIHFARWVLLDDGRLVFFSNYDGSFEAYLGEFIERARQALTMIWSNTEDFPTSFGWVFGGASHEARFKRWTRAHQLPTPLWYSAYPELSVREVLDNARLRELLAGNVFAAGAERLLGMLRD